MFVIDRTLNCRDSLCPGPMIEASRAIKGMAVNAVLEVLTTDPGFLLDIQAFCKSTGHALLHTERDEVGVRVLIRRTR